MTELVWDGKYKDGKKQGPVRIALPFQTIETVNESAQERQKSLELFSAGREPEWRNRLIWGDKKYVLPSLLPEFAGKLNLVYIDPPFDTGTDFSYTASIPDHPDSPEDETAYFTKEASVIEQKAYRDTWGSGLNSYLHWFYESILLLRELLAGDGVIFVHTGQNIAHYTKLVLDEVFGSDRYLNQIIWKRQTAHSDVTQGAQHLGRLHDVIFLYTNSDDYEWEMQYTPYDEDYAGAFYKYVEPQSGRRYRLSDITAPGKSLKGNPYYEFLGVKRYWRFSEKKMKELYEKGRIVQTKPGTVPAQKRYLDEMPGVPLQDVWLDIKPIQSQATERVGYDTQKPEALLERILKLSSREGDLLLDCFVGSGTTAVVAEKLNRRWIACDLSRFAIHTTRKRLLGIPSVKPFIVQNLGKYERQAWQVAEFPANGQNRLEEQREREAAYRNFILALAVAWQFLNAARESEEVAKDYAKTFLVLAPNVIVFDRLKTDFAGGRIFRTDPVIPKELEIFWDFDCVMRGEAEKAHAEGTLFLTNIQQFYERPDRSAEEEPNAMTEVLGPRPPTKKLELTDFGDRIALRAGHLLVINDEAHHTHEEENEWNKVIHKLHDSTPLAAQLDFTATPKFQKGAIFPWTISDYPLKQAIIDGIVKRPMKGIAKIHEAKSEHASIRYQAYLTAGVERWREYREQLRPLKRKPVLFIMMNDTDDADDVDDWLKRRYPGEFGGERTQVIHTDKSGEVSKKDLDSARKAVREVDREDSPINAIVSVLMLREGWDVQNVTVVVGLRPYTAKANILPEQTIGRGLRLMFRDLPTSYMERVDIIGNKAFLDFVDDLEKLEELKLDTFELGKDKLRIVTILPLEDRKEFDIGLPVLTPSLVRKKSLAEEIARLDVMGFQSVVLPMSEDDPRTRTFTYEGYDIITLKKEFEREYTIPEPQTAQEVIGYYARRIAEAVKLPAQFAVLAPKVKEFFEHKAFGHSVDLGDAAIVKAMSTAVAHYVCIDVFKKELQKLTVEEQTPQLLEPARMLSTCQPFPWSRPVWEGQKCVFNLVPCDNDFEREFAKFLDNATDVRAFSKLPRAFGFAIEYTDAAMNLRNYEPDFVAVDSAGTHWLLESKGQETIDVLRKDAAAAGWCENATRLTGTEWKYLKVPQKEFQTLQPSRLADLNALRATIQP